MMSRPMTMFELGQRAMSAQMVRMNAAASNLANAGSIAATEAETYRPLRAVFSEQLDAATGMSTVHVNGVFRGDTPAVRRHEPGHPLADENGDVWTSGVDENAESVEMMEASRQYQNIVEALSTAKQLMLETMRMK
ncbi:flagellar basal body rod protein FlgC [Altererythrobacter xixiisoli]|uniref:Flagellar basal-body rod protein FlgC n=2 Tax=Croceibacterium xixiisoli TaxID=1476466 RepID=A0A6I4TUH8_9SPHN|nr:flagellar basal body rod protein FlgC [Croceibacterium xixiisoli]